MTTVIAIVSQKGGVGKSSFARALAREAAVSGVRVKIADLDTQQGTSVDWHRRRLHNGIEPVLSVEAFSTAGRALASIDQLDLLVIDGPARTSKATLEIARAADLVVQPTGASADDLRPAVREFHALTKAQIPNSKLVFVLMRTGTDAEEGAARDFLSEAGYTILDGSIPERPAYRRAQDAGYAVTETPYATLNKKADVLIQLLIDRIT
ncbi:MAG: ParA family protein [Gammaproteobacteria bacterium]|nr:ParA family protein [Gammaproteobacteria bacterium]